MTLLIWFSGIICGLAVEGAPSPITKINSVFEVFNPIAMVKFFEFSDKGWNISKTCVRDMFWYLEAIQQDYLWPIKCEFEFGISVMVLKPIKC